GDCLAIQNTNLFWKEILIEDDTFKWNTAKNNIENAKSYEILKVRNRIYFTTELNNYHFPFIKNYRKNDYKQLNWVSLDDFIKNYKEKLKNQIDFKMLEYKTLKKVYKKLTSSTSDKI
ncbi:beta-1,4-N-acetylgalactosaminyltransferase, partial [Campylobacter jejuni]|nr:beta-1,4-N-acetylgalactosaminyltransferase [Campylobacter jejuni]EAL9501462.1 beta-1,4-N-acetylgalactosaminyltransferase [Campylobacter jejuni]